MDSFKIRRWELLQTRVRKSATFSHVEPYTLRDIRMKNFVYRYINNREYNFNQIECEKNTHNYVRVCWFVATLTALKAYITFINFVVCLTTGPQSLSKRVPLRVRSSAPSFNFQHTLVSLSPSTSCLRRLHRLPITSILSSIFPSITCFRRQLLRILSPIQITLSSFCRM